MIAEETLEGANLPVVVEWTAHVVAYVEGNTLIKNKLTLWRL